MTMPLKDLTPGEIKKFNEQREYWNRHEEDRVGFIAELVDEFNRAGQPAGVGQTFKVIAGGIELTAPAMLLRCPWQAFIRADRYVRVVGEYAVAYKVRFGRGDRCSKFHKPATRADIPEIAAAACEDMRRSQKLVEALVASGQAKREIPL